MDGVDACEGDESAFATRVPCVVVDVGVPHIGQSIVDAFGVSHCFVVAIESPAFEDGEGGEVYIVAREDDLLAWAGPG